MIFIVVEKIRELPRRWTTFGGRMSPQIADAQGTHERKAATIREPHLAERRQSALDGRCVASPGVVRIDLVRRA